MNDKLNMQKSQYDKTPTWLIVLDIALVIFIPIILMIAYFSFFFFIFFKIENTVTEEMKYHDYYYEEEYYNDFYDEDDSFNEIMYIEEN